MNQPLRTKKYTVHSLSDTIVHVICTLTYKNGNTDILASKTGVRYTWSNPKAGASFSQNILSYFSLYWWRIGVKQV